MENENAVIAYNVINNNVSTASKEFVESVKTMLSLGFETQEYSAKSGGKFCADNESAMLIIDAKTTIIINVLRHK